MNYAIFRSIDNINERRDYFEIFDLESGEGCVNSNFYFSGVILTKLAFSNNGLWVCCLNTSDVGQLPVVDQLEVRSLADESLLFAQSGKYRNLLFSYDNQYLIVEQDINGEYKLKIFNTHDWSLYKIIDLTIVGTSYIDGLVMSRDNQWIVLILGSALPARVNFETGEQRTFDVIFPDGDPTPSRQSINDCDFSSDGRYLAVAASAFAYWPGIENWEHILFETYAVIDTATWEKIDVPIFNYRNVGYIEKLRFTPDGQYLMIGAAIIPGSDWVDGLHALRLSDMTLINLGQDAAFWAMYMHPHMNRMTLQSNGLLSNEAKSESYVVYDTKNFEIASFGKQYSYLEDMSLLRQGSGEANFTAISSKPYLTSIVGKVFDSHGLPSSTRISIINPTTGKTERSVLSNEDGQYRFFFRYTDIQERTLVAFNPETGNDMVIGSRKPS